MPTTAQMENLLEVISTYTHQVAGMNAGNVSGMRFVAALLDRAGDSTRAAQLRSEAKDLADRINRLLYVTRQRLLAGGPAGRKF